MTEGDPERVRRVLNLIRERVDPAGLSVLDLACRTGAFSTALAEVGADVLGIDGRQENLDQTPPSKARYLLGDVRDLNVAEHSQHDVTLCLGILYHLDIEEALHLLRQIRAVTRRFAIVDTHTGTDTETATLNNVDYHGSLYAEPDSPWASIGNPRSWWFTEASLHDAIRAAGWQTITPVPGPGWHGEAADRRWLVIS